MILSPPQRVSWRQELSIDLAPEVQKAQWLRLLDVFVLGPLLVWQATRPANPRWARAAFAVAGIGAIVYNWNNYEHTQRLMKANAETSA